MRNSKNLLDLTCKDFAGLFGTTEEEIVTYCGDLIENSNFHYRKLKGEERDQLILRVLSIVDAKKVLKVEEGRLPDWEEGWSENFEEFEERKDDVERLVPKYFKKNVPIRLFGEYVQPMGNDFVLNLTKIFRSWLFKKYFQSVDHIHEFGCGSGWHLAYLASVFSGKHLYGYDWTSASQKILQALAQNRGWKIQGRHFDFFHPDRSVTIPLQSATYTFGALEQVGNNHGPFLEFLLEKSPEICINVEPLHELYNHGHLLDYLALRYHNYRNYLNAYLTRLQELEAKGRIKILKVHHQRFGNLCNDTHSYVVWRPL